MTDPPLSPPPDRRSASARLAGRHETTTTTSVSARGNDLLLDAESPAQPEKAARPGDGTPVHREDHAATETASLRRQLVPRLPDAMAIATSRERRQRGHPVAATLRQPCRRRLGPRPQQLPHLQRAPAEGILHSAPLPGPAVAVVAATHTTRRATSLAHHAVDRGAVAPVAAVSSAVASVEVSMTVLLLVPAAPSAVQHLTRLPSAARATRPQQRTPAPCASVITSPICQRRFRVAKKRLKRMTRARS
jgi:hypothetical protein